MIICPSCGAWLEFPTWSPGETITLTCFDWCGVSVEFPRNGFDNDESGFLDYIKMVCSLETEYTLRDIFGSEYHRLKITQPSPISVTGKMKDQ